MSSKLGPSSAAVKSGSAPVAAVKEIRAVHHACEILEAVSAHQPIGVSELARQTGIDKSAVQRILVTLRSAGWLQACGSPGTRWELSPSNPLLHHAARGTLEGTARPAMRQLRDRSQETVLLIAWSEGQLVLQAAEESPQLVRLSPRVGVVLPLDGSAGGATVTAHLPEAERLRVQAAHPSITDALLERTRRRGWAGNDREVAEGVRAVAAPLLAADGYPLGALAVCGPATRVSRSDMERLGAMAAEVAAGVVVG